MIKVPVPVVTAGNVLIVIRSTPKPSIISATLKQKKVDISCHRFNKTCLKWPLKIDKTKVLMANCSLMKLENIAECPLEHSAKLLTYIKH